MVGSTLEFNLLKPSCRHTSHRSRWATRPSPTPCTRGRWRSCWRSTNLSWPHHRSGRVAPAAAHSFAVTLAHSGELNPLDPHCQDLVPHPDRICRSSGSCVFVWRSQQCGQRHDRSHNHPLTLPSSYQATSASSSVAVTARLISPPMSPA